MSDSRVGETSSEAVAEDLTDIETIKIRSVSGIIAITSRTLFLQIIALISTFLLTIFLSPQEYGVFFIVSAIINFLVYFSDVGLAAALIQKKSSLSQDELATVFTIQQLLVATLVFLAFMASSLVANFYHLSTAGIWLFRSLAFSLLLSSWKTIPSIKLERSLEFSKLVIPQIVETLLFYLTAVFLAWKGWGITAFTYAVLIRSLSGLVVMYLLCPWRPEFKINKATATSLLSFGFPFQLNSLMALIKDDLLIAFLGKVLTLSELGFIGWAQKWALFPLRMFSDSINKVTFPTYARLQDNPDILKKGIEKSLFFSSLFIFPLVIGLMAISPAFINLFPRYLKWQPALTSLSLFAITSIWSSVSLTLTNTLSAIGHIKTNLKLMVMWTALTWITTPLLILKIGFNGVALSAALVAFTSLVPIIIVKRLMNISVGPNVIPSLLISILTGLSAYFLSGQTSNLYSLLIVILLSGILYIVLTWAIQQEKIRYHSQTFAKVFKLS